MAGGRQCPFTLWGQQGQQLGYRAIGQRGDKVESEGNIILLMFPVSGKVDAHVTRIREL